MGRKDYGVLSFPNIWNYLRSPLIVKLCVIVEHSYLSKSPSVIVEHSYYSKSPRRQITAATKHKEHELNYWKTMIQGRTSLAKLVHSCENHIYIYIYPSAFSFPYILAFPLPYFLAILLQLYSDPFCTAKTLFCGSTLHPQSWEWLLSHTILAEWKCKSFLCCPAFLLLASIYGLNKGLHWKCWCCIH